MIEAGEHLNPDTLSAFVDGEVSSAEQGAVERHIAGCQACALRVLSAGQLKRATALAGSRFTPPSQALARLTAQLRAEAGPRVLRLSFRRAAWAGLAAALVLAVSMMGWRIFHQANMLSAELLDQHLATLSSGATPQIISSDRHTVKPWFQGRLPFSFNLPDALPPDTNLKGADLTYLDGQPAALLLFTIHKHEVSIFVTQRSGGPNLSALPGARAGFSIKAASTHDLRIVAVSDVNPVDVDALVASLVKAQSPY